MSGSQSTLVLKENRLPKLDSGISSLTIDHTANMDEVNKGRVTLQTLQPSAKVKGLVGSHGQIIHPGKEALKPKRNPSIKTQNCLGKIQVFEDGESTSVGLQKKNKVENKSVQTDTSDLEDIKSMTTDDISVDYYSTLAERRREALTEALEENEQLHREVDSLKSEIVALKAENSILKPLAEEAQYLAGVLKDLVGDATDEAAGDSSDAKDS